MRAGYSKMLVEVWSDIMCPFCYLGKRKFEIALSQFPEKDNVEVVWKSFLLNPHLKTDTSTNVYDYLSNLKGIEIDQAKRMTANISLEAKALGLEFNFDKVVVSNTFRAHIFLHAAKEVGKQHEAKNTLFKAHFAQGKNVDDIATLLELGTEIGLDPEKLFDALENKSFFNEVERDIYESRQLGIKGVPFFLFDQSIVVTGAQESSVFLDTLKKSFFEWSNEND